MEWCGSDVCMNESNKNQNVIVGLLAVLALFAVCTVLTIAQSVILPLIIAWLLSYILGPVVTTLERRRIPSGLSITVVLLLLFGFCYLGGFFLYGRAVMFWQAYPRYQASIMEMLESVTSKWDLPGLLDGVNWWPKIGGYMAVTADSLISFSSQLVMVMIYLVFLLLGKPYFSYKLKKAFPSERGNKLAKVLFSISSQTGKYLFLQMIISLATGICVWGALSIMGVDFAVTWGAFAFFLNFIPTVGSMIASIPPIMVALVQPDGGGLGFALMVALVLLTIQMVIGNGIAPKVMGDQLNLSPVVVLISLVMWGSMWGIVGALLSTPIAAAVKIICENVEALKPISTLMGSGKSIRKEALATAGDT